ncbi:MAG: methyltransferase [Rhodospirillales bacterium]|jgi:predicted O-methyltransferase YrrM|nr:methyltransferase [Rhodospirillales bacterium]
MSLAPHFDAQRARFAEFLKAIDRYADAFAAIGANNPPEPRWDQVWFPRLDACAAYTMVREHQPTRIVEIGSGHSTRFMARAIRDGGLTTRITSIDPAPRATLDGLAIERISKRVQDVGLPVLAAGDMLFIDSSHVAKPGSDVDHLLRRIVPDLTPGTIIHFHDIFLPDPYPPEWDYRGYTEQMSVAAMLASGAYDLLFASRYVATRMADEIARSCVAALPLKDGAFENSLWLRKL